MHDFWHYININSYYIIPLYQGFIEWGGLYILIANNLISYTLLELLIENEDKEKQ